jgi:ubiquinone/menaquinone biosynthesis C-methylase UbiE
MKKAYERSYLSHQKNIDNIEYDRLYYIRNKTCIGYQRITKPLKFLAPFINDKNHWLTIGDLNGVEANYLSSHQQEATASDISDNFLKKVHDEGLIDHYSAVNVEAIHFEDNTFDYCFCKEAYHHFPRAYLGLYEMIRVSKKATILMEPVDVLSKMPLLLLMKNVLDFFGPTLINKIWKNRFSFETVGNYVFKLSDREIEKVAMGLGLRCIAFNKMNVSYQTIDQTILKSTSNKSKLRKLSMDIYLRDILGKLGLIPYNLLIAVIFKEEPTEAVRQAMRQLNYQIIDLPENPYLNKP